MRIKKLSIHNFGVYGGDYSIDLMPKEINNFNRPIVLFIGKNGVGKSTLVEALRLCLHGPLSLSNRTGQTEYEEYLLNRIHRSPDTRIINLNAFVELEFDYVDPGGVKEYRIIRRWGVKRKRINQELIIFENEKEINLPFEQKESFLRELVPPSTTALFFFDGEKLQTFIQEITNNIVLANTIKSFLGLNLVSQLQEDLDIYISRQIVKNGQTELKTDLENTTELLKEKETLQENIVEQKRLNWNKLNKIRESIANQEQIIASEGGWYAKLSEDLRSKKEQVEIEIELCHRQIQEMCGGLLPFSLSPTLLMAASKRLILENEYEKINTSRLFLEEQWKTLKTEIESEDFWENIDINTRDRRKVFRKIKATITKPLSLRNKSPDSLIFQVSEQERNTLLSWIAQSLDTVPKQFGELINRLKMLEEKHDEFQNQLLLNPAEEKITPLVETLNRLNKQLGALEQCDSEMGISLQKLNKEIDGLLQSLHKIREKIAETEVHNSRVQLASKTQSVLEDYNKLLTKEKLNFLENELVNKFNLLCHKKLFIDSAHINQETFSITLFRRENSFSSNDLSSGEKQLFAIAMLWSLHHLSGLPAPIVIDTPLARLDIEHRHSILHNYLPFASHQVIVLATDAEIAHETLPELIPYTSHGFNLSFNEVAGVTEITDLNV